MVIFPEKYCHKNLEEWEKYSRKPGKVKKKVATLEGGEGRGKGEALSPLGIFIKNPSHVPNQGRDIKIGTNIPMSKFIFSNFFSSFFYYQVNGIFHRW